MGQFIAVATAYRISAVVVLGACAGGVRTSPPVLYRGQPSPFTATLDYLREEFRKETIPMTARVLVGRVGHYAPRRLDLDAHIINISQVEADDIRSLLRAEGLTEAHTLEWGDCPTFKMMGGDRSACPDSSFANVAIGSPERVVVDAEDRTLLGRPLAPTEVIVPTIVTFIGPWGGHTRFQSLLLHQDTNGWTVLRVLWTRYDE